MSDIRMPKPETIRKHNQTILSDEELLRLAEWTVKHTKRQFIKPDNQILTALIAYEEEKQA